MCAQGANATSPVTAHGECLSAPSNASLVQTIYFDFDTSNIKLKDLVGLQAYSRELVRNPEKRIIVVGHTDQHGSKEYNLALSMVRATNVAKALNTWGVPTRQVETQAAGSVRPCQTDPTGTEPSKLLRGNRVEIFER